MVSASEKNRLILLAAAAAWRSVVIVYIFAILGLAIIVFNRKMKTM